MDDRTVVGSDDRSGDTTADAVRARQLREIEDLERRLADAKRRRARTTRPRTETIPRRDNDLAGYPLTAGQEQLLFVERFAPGLAAYNLPFGLRLRGELDIAALAGALGTVIARHDALRTAIGVRDGQPVQVISAPAPVELTPEPCADEAELASALDTAATTPFDLAAGPLIRYRLYRLAADDHTLAITTHHIISDGWSTALLITELAECYTAAVEHRTPNLAELSVQYPDFALWQRERLTSTRGTADLDHWQRQLAGLPTLALPTDRPRPDVPSFRGDLIDWPLPGPLADRLRTLARANSASLFMTLMAGFDALLSRYTHQDDIVIGTASAGRDRTELEPVVGFFTNMLVLRCDLSGDPAFTQVLAKVKDVALTAYDHQDVPFEQVVARVRPDRDPSRNPLFQVSFGLLPGQVDITVRMADLTVDVVGGAQGTARFDIAINVLETESELRVQVEYATDLFDASRVNRMLEHYQRLLDAVCTDPSLRLSQLPLLSDTELDQVLREWQGEVREYRRAPVHTMIAEQVARTPDAQAVVFDGMSLTYAELDHRAAVLTHTLIAHGVAPDDVVGVAVERSLHVPTALLGVLKAGAAFVPIETTHPKDRIATILSDAGARIVLTTSDLLDRLPANDDWRVVLLDELEYGGQPEPLPELATLNSAAYILYTSGSTGRPKGVVIEHHALATYIDFLGNVFDFGPGDRMLQFSSLVFDLAEGELFTGLSRGATMVLVPRDTTVSPAALSELLRRERVSYLGAPPAMIALLDPEPYPALRGLLVGGEAFTGDLVNRWNLPGRLFLNAYGPTEATIGCTYYPCERKVWRSSPPIGRAMPHRRVYLLDRWGVPVPVGVPGEIVSAGPGLARGYVHDDVLTAKKFVPDPFVPGERMYRTGDLAVWTRDGQIQFLGRLDTQIKLRGQRIELEEVETVLSEHIGVAHAVVALRTDTPSGAGLVAYVVPADPAAPPSPAELREHVAGRLPGYMVPAAYVGMAEIPLGVTGKVDRASLPAPDSADTALAEYVQPRTDSEKIVVAAFADVLGHDRVGALDSFFDLGGNSLQATLVLTRIAENTGVELPMRHFYSVPTVEVTAAAIDDALTGAAHAADTDPIVTIRADGAGAPVFCLPSVSGSAYTYVALARRLAPGRPILGFEAPGLESGPPMNQVADLARYYLPAMTRRQPTGPYHLLGYSMGGLVAVELANLLRARGDEVALLVLVDTSVPEPGPPPDDIRQLFVDNLAGMAGLPAPTATTDDLATLLRDAGLVPDGVTADFVRRRLAVFTGNARAIAAYQPRQPFDGRITLIRAAESPDTRPGWARFAAGIDDTVIPGDHYTIWHDSNIAALAAALDAGLAR
ncbi:MAG TPA: amino acid adenylation domain-containing protein [Pseudonocardiaceae bacterium]|nr:amino acid adenylation domain-containing protein [Pseudonocardiaceae bacterium]